jgi:hypothetical protein
VFGAAESPVCLLGGWAVHLHVNTGFQNRHSREYIGSRDIDLGVHVEPDSNKEELRNQPVGESISAIKDLGYTESRFGFVQNFLRSNHEPINEDEASNYGMHEIFQVYVDIIPDTNKLQQFKNAFGFKPPSEKLLKPVFTENKSQPLSEYVSWSPTSGKQIVTPELLAAMKIRSIPHREKTHKQIKDIADLHALLWYVKDYNSIKQDVLNHVSSTDLKQLHKTVDQNQLKQAANLLQIKTQLLKNSIQQLPTADR